MGGMLRLEREGDSGQGMAGKVGSRRGSATICSNSCLYLSKLRGNRDCPGPFRCLEHNSPKCAIQRPNQAIQQPGPKCAIPEPKCAIQRGESAPYKCHTVPAAVWRTWPGVWRTLALAWYPPRLVEQCAIQPAECAIQPAECAIQPRGLYGICMAHFCFFVWRTLALV